MPVATFPCTSCGAELEFKPGSHALTCPYCQAQNEIPHLDEEVEEEDFQLALAAIESSQETIDRITVHCDSCGADIPMQENVTSQACPFCGSNVVATGKTNKLIRPKSVLPFAIDKGKARAMFERWLASLWWAPSDLKKFAAIESVSGIAGGSTARGSTLTGMYLPYWTYDAAATTPYTGQRGDDYWVSVPYTTTVNGRTVTRTRQVRRTRWRWVSGTVHDRFDDILIPGSTSLPPERLAKLGHWDLKNLAPYRDEYLSGFRAESYTIGLVAGFDRAQQVMVEGIKRSIRRDIGGDHQRISEMRPHYSGITFKHILLPIWVSAYRYRGRVFRFLVNARTGTISGERPYSVWKIGFAITVALLLAAAVVLLLSRNS